MYNTIFKALNKTRNKINSLISFINEGKVNAEKIELIEEKLLGADIGYETVENILEIIKNTKEKEIKNKIKSHLLSLLPKKIEKKNIKSPTVLLVVGVNGTGKTTTAAKLASFYKKNNYQISLIAADTYRAAAIDQLKIWSERVDCHLVYNVQTSDPSAILFDGLISAKSKKSDIIIVDTAGRLHNYENLMFELKKMYTVVHKKFPEFLIKTLITIDANLGQNSIAQAEGFNKYIKLNGAVLTKLDGTARGGIVFQLYQKLGLPVQYIGFGEKIDDIDVFRPEMYVNSLFGFDNINK